MNIIFMHKLDVFTKHNGIAKQYVGGPVDLNIHGYYSVEGNRSNIFSCERTKEHLIEE
jgi:hypothetical protein